MCGKNAYNYEFELENLCFSCFEQKYGKVLLFTDRAEYYGGHKNNEERKQGIQQVVKEIRVEFIETSAAVVALDQQCEKGFLGSKVDSARIVSDEDGELLGKLSSDEDGELLETVSKLSISYLI